MFIKIADDKIVCNARLGTSIYRSDRIEWISYEGLLPIHVDGSTSIQLIRKYCLYNEDEQGTLISNTIDGDSTAIRLLHTES